MIPTVHLNGTGKQHLVQELLDAHKAVGAAILALHQVTVHGRDFYPQGPNAYGQARHEMDARLLTLHALQDELRQMFEGVEGQGR